MTHLEGERRRGKRRSVIVEIQHLDLELADALFGRPALVFGRHRQSVEGSLFVIQRYFGADDSSRLINRKRIKSVRIFTYRNQSISKTIIRRNY